MKFFWWWQKVGTGNTSTFAAFSQAIRCASVFVLPGPNYPCTRVLGGARKWLKFCGAAWHKVIGLVWHGSHLTSTVSLYRTAPQSAKNFHAPPSTSADHEFMVQSRDQMLESSGTALARMYHNFV